MMGVRTRGRGAGKKRLCGLQRTSLPRRDSSRPAGPAHQQHHRHLVIIIIIIMIIVITIVIINIIRSDRPRR